jgi:hypothetical protein
MALVDPFTVDHTDTSFKLVRNESMLRHGVVKMPSDDPIITFYMVAFNKLTEVRCDPITALAKSLGPWRELLSLATEGPMRIFGVL